MRIGLLGVLGSTIGGVSACAGPGQYVWFDQLPPSELARGSEYTIGVGDVVDVRVLGHEEMTLKQKVRYDGRFALPILGEIEARGKRPSALRAELEARLKEFIQPPIVVTVNIDDAPPMSIVLLGEVGRPGMISLEPNSGLARALAMGGGLTDYASQDSIYVVRGAAPKYLRIRFRYRDIARNEGHAGDFPLQPGDLIEVE